MGPSELMRLKKLFVNDLIATITGIEEEHIEWLLNHIQIKKGASQHAPAKQNAVEIDEFGSETILDNYNNSQRDTNHSGQISESESSEGETGNSTETDEIFHTSKSDIIWITLEEAAVLKDHLDDYNMLLASEVLLLSRPNFERDVRDRREELKKNQP